MKGSKRTRTTYTGVFKAKAINLYHEVGATKAARKLGVPVNNLYKWAGKGGRVTHTAKAPRPIVQAQAPTLLTLAQRYEDARSALLAYLERG